MQAEVAWCEQAARGSFMSPASGPVALRGKFALLVRMEGHFRVLCPPEGWQHTQEALQLASTLAPRGMRDAGPPGTSSLPCCDTGPCAIHATHQLSSVADGREVEDGPSLCKLGLSPPC